jgi:hypothetical protein
MSRRVGIAAIFLLAASLVGFAQPAPASAAAVLEAWNHDTGARYSWPAMAQTVTTSGGGQLSLSLWLSRRVTDTATFRVEIRTTNLAYPTGDTRSNTGRVLAAATLNPLTSAAGGPISTDGATPSRVDVAFADAPIMSAGTYSIVVLRGASSHLFWHASLPGDPDAYANGSGWVCGDICWADTIPGGAHDFAFEAGLYTRGLVPPGSPPSAPVANVIAPFAPTRASALIFDVRFLEPVVGLTKSDFTRSGTATGCTIRPPTATGPTIYQVTVTGCSAGTLRLTLKALSVRAVGVPTVLGPVHAVASPAMVRIDRGVPTVSRPSATLRQGGSLSGSALPVRLTWSGSDAGNAGIDYYKVWKTTNGGTSWTFVAQTRSTSLNVTAAPGGSVQYRIRAWDKAGNRSAYKVGATIRPRLIQQSSSSVRFGRSWTTQVDAAYSGGSAKSSSSTGAWATFSFTGRAVGVVMTRDQVYGQVKVYVDGVLVKTVDTYAASRADRVLVYAKTWSFSATHRVTVKVVGTTARPRVDLDAFVRF